MHLLLAIGLLGQEDDARVRARLHAHSYSTRTRSQEFLTGRDSGILVLEEEAGLPEIAPAFGLDLEWGPWDLQLRYSRRTARERLDSPLTFEDAAFPSGARIRTESSLFELVGSYQFRLIDDSEFRLEAGPAIAFTRFFLSVDSGELEGHEGHPALWPVPAVALRSFWRISEHLSLHVDASATWVRYVNYLHLDGGEPPEITYGMVSMEAGILLRLGGAFELGAGFSFALHKLRDEAEEDIHQVSVQAWGPFLSLSVRF